MILDCYIIWYNLCCEQCDVELSIEEEDIMKKMICTILSVFAIWAGMTSIAAANTIIFVDEIEVAEDVDLWSFSLDTDADLTFNILANEDRTYDFFDNGFGNDGLDSVIFLYHTNGLSIASNDDSMVAGFDSDGTVRPLDSFLHFNNFSAGNYILAVTGYRAFNAGPVFDGVNPGGYSTGHYQLTVSSNTGNITMPQVNPVPEPSTILLLGSGLAGLIWYRRRKL